MGRGKTLYNKETERARQMNGTNKKKYTGEVQNRLHEKIYGKEKVDNEFNKDINDLFKRESNNEVIMNYKKKHMKKLENFIKEEEEEKQKAKEGDFRQINFTSIEDANNFYDRFEKNHKFLLKNNHILPTPFYYLFKKNEHIFGIIDNDYVKEILKIQSIFNYTLKDGYFIEKE